FLCKYGLYNQLAQVFFSWRKILDSSHPTFSSRFFVFSVSIIEMAGHSRNAALFIVFFLTTDILTDLMAHIKNIFKLLYFGRQVSEFGKQKNPG
ncbi:MAG: hypothetical protein JW787_07660, partial [Sedimentisphaerales bacterium]|nr:hypothetical protein [Sedimentisphaerales bacterium]